MPLTMARSGFHEETDLFEIDYSIGCSTRSR